MKIIFQNLKILQLIYFIKFKLIIGQGYSSICEYLTSNHNIDVKDVVPDENKPFTKQFYPETKNFILSDYLSLETKKLFAAAQVAQIEAGRYY